jgi:hypothetical protein
VGCILNRIASRPSFLSKEEAVHSSSTLFNTSQPAAGQPAAGSRSFSIPFQFPCNSHHHECSLSIPTCTRSRKHPCHRCSLSHFHHSQQDTTMAVATALPQRQWVPSLPTSFIASLNPFASPAVKPDDTTQNGDKHSRTLSELALKSGPPSPTKSSASIMFAEPSSQGTSLSESREGSIVDGKRQAKKNKPKTSFSICHPPPASSARQKMHRRPRSLLQLHKVVPNSRPLPAYEVIPSTNFSVRLRRATNRVFSAKHSLCPNDLVVLRAEDYYSEEPAEDQEARDVVALICKGRKDDGAATGKAKICMAGGEEWDAYPLPNGGYEFFTTDQHGLGLTVRWVPKKSKKDNAKPDSRRFNFSTITAGTRRHPIIANLSKTSLAILDTYKMPELSTATPTATPKQHATLLEDGLDSDDAAASKQEIRTTDDALRAIISMTSIYVAFKEGWSPYFKYDDRDQQASSSRRNSVHTPVSTPPASPTPTPAMMAEKRTSILSVSSSLFRKSSLRSANRSSRTSTVLDPNKNNTQDSLSRSGSIKTTGRARADSSSTVLVHRAASNRRSNRSQATWRPDLLSPGKQNEVRETSREGTPQPEVIRSLNASRTPSAANAGVDSKRASMVQPEQRKVEVDSDESEEEDDEAEEQTSAAPPPKRAQVQPDMRASSNATSENTAATAAAAPNKKPTVAQQEGKKEKKGKKWKKWVCGKF